MEVNRPDKGIFKGIGSMEKDSHINKKIFPKLRNKHQFEYNHNHGNFYQSNFSYFYKTKFFGNSATNRVGYQKVKKYPNSSQIVLGNDHNDFRSFSQANYKKYQQTCPPKPIYRKQQGILLGDQPSKSLFKTSHQQLFSAGRSLSSKQNITYKDWRRNQKFNPITGESKDINKTFGYEDFKYNGEKERGYKANNFTKVPKTGEKYDIITGRKLAYA